MAGHDHHQEKEPKAESLIEKINEKIHGHDDSPKTESLIEKINEKIHGHDDSSSSSDDDKKKTEKTSPFKDKVFRLFGRERPVRKILGGGKAADVFMWRNKKISAGVLGVATAIWVLFEVIEYHLLTLVCHGLILALAVLFLWSNASTFINKSRPRLPEVSVPEKSVLRFASDLRVAINQGLALLRDIASGRELKKFLLVVAGLWFFSILGSCCDFLTLVYITTVFLHTVPVIYDKYEDHIDSFAEKGLRELKKQCAVFDEKVLSKIPRGPMKERKRD